MQVASVLSDLTSLRVCPTDAALALVTPQKSAEEASRSDDNDPDLKRANDLMALHASVKERYTHQGGNPALTKAREDVAKVEREMGL